MCGGGSCGKGTICCGFVPKCTQVFCCSPCMCPMCPTPADCPEICCKTPCSKPKLCNPCRCEPCKGNPYKVKCFSFTSPPRWIDTKATVACYQPMCPRPILLTYNIIPTPCACPKTFTCVQPEKC